MAINPGTTNIFNILTDGPVLDHRHGGSQHTWPGEMAHRQEKTEQFGKVRRAPCMDGQDWNWPPGRFPKQILWFPLLNLHTFPVAGTSPPPLTDKFLSILKLTSKETVSLGLTKSVGSASSLLPRPRHPTHSYGPGSDRLVFVLYQHFPFSKFPWHRLRACLWARADKEVQGERRPAAQKPQSPWGEDT